MAPGHIDGLALGWGCAAVVLALVAAPVQAQSGRSDMEQVDSPAAGAAQPIAQVSGEARLLLLPQQRADREAVPPAQLTTDGEARSAQPQLTDEEGRIRAPRQLYQGGKTAQPSQALSHPSEGRTGAASPVAGKDRCDPAAAEAKAKRCESVIETRSAEFTRPDPGILSAEQRLLIDQQLREAPSGARTAVRRLGSTGFEPGSIEEQGVAAIALQGSDAAGKAPDPADDPAKNELDPAVQAVIGIIADLTPRS